jgi:hypothetical protein
LILKMKNFLKHWWRHRNSESWWDGVGFYARFH